MSTATVPARLSEANSMTDAQIYSALKTHHSGRHLKGLMFGAIVVMITAPDSDYYWFPTAWFCGLIDARDYLRAQSEETRAEMRVLDLENLK